MTRQITSQTTLENLKNEAKRWLKELRRNDPQARQRLQNANPKAKEAPTLRDIQHAIALEFGLKGWNDLKRALESQERGEPLVMRFLDYACPDHHIRGRPAHRMATHAAIRLLQQHPEIAHENIYTAVVCGEFEEVERRLRERPELATSKSSPSSPEREGPGGSGDLFLDIGPKGWEPLLYLCFTRLPLAKTNDNAVAIARLLLDHGADPNAYFMAGDSKYTPLTGIIGEGEEDRPAHPQREELTHLLLERGANSYDVQVHYNIHFRGKVLWFLQQIYDASIKAGRRADWDDPNWHMLDMGGYGCGARWYLSMAIQNNDLELARWCLTHGASADAPPPPHKGLPQGTLLSEAFRREQIEMAELIGRSADLGEIEFGGAVMFEEELEGEEAFLKVCVARNREVAEALIKRNPELLRSPVPLHAAAERDNADVAEFLLDLGVSPDVENSENGSQGPLHVAAYHGALRVANVLIKAGAKIDPVDSTHNATPLWFAMWADQTEMITLLSRYSRDVWALSFTGHVQRVREVLLAEPDIAKSGAESTPLFWLPEDESQALELVEMFLSVGVDASFRRRADGRTAAEVARRRGLHAVAGRLGGSR